MNLSSRLRIQSIYRGVCVIRMQGKGACLNEYVHRQNIIMSVCVCVMSDVTSNLNIQCINEFKWWLNTMIYLVLTFHTLKNRLGLMNASIDRKSWSMKEKSTSTNGYMCMQYYICSCLSIRYCWWCVFLLLLCTFASNCSVFFHFFYIEISIRSQD